MKLIDNDGQGDCLFLAVSEALVAQGRSRRAATDLRNLCVTHLRKHEATYSAFWRGDAPNAEQSDIKSQGFAEYLRLIGRDKAWGGSIELAALASTLNQPIFVVRPLDGEFDIRVFGPTNSKATPLTLWFQHRHYQALVGDVEAVSAQAVKAEVGDPADRGGAPRSVSSLGGCTAASKRTSRVRQAPSTLGGHTDVASTLGGRTIARATRASKQLSAEDVPDCAASSAGGGRTAPNFRGGAPSTLGGRTRASSLGGRTASARVVASTSGAVSQSAGKVGLNCAASSLGGRTASRGSKRPRANDADDDVEGAHQVATPSKHAQCQRRFRENPLAQGVIPRFVCQHCDFVYENPSRNSVSSARAHHLTRFHGGAGLPGAIRVDYGIFRSLSKAECDAERYAWKCPLCRFGLPEGALASKYAKETAVARHRQQRHPSVSDADYQKAACGQAHARLRALARRRASCANKRAVRHDSQPLCPPTGFAFVRRPCLEYPPGRSRGKFTVRRVLQCLKCCHLYASPPPVAASWVPSCCKRAASRPFATRKKEHASRTRTLERRIKAVRATKHGFPVDQLEDLFREALATKVEEVVALVREHHLLVLALQEIDLNSASVASVTAAFKRHGLRFFAGPSNGQCHRVGLVASLECKPLVLHGLSEPSRAVAVLTELRCADSVRKVVFASLYGQVGDLPAASAHAREVISQLSMAGHCWVALGDYNVTLEEDPWAGVLSSLPSARALDEDFACCGPLPLTSPGRVRRIDYGVASSLVAATEVVSFSGCSDHLGTAYGLNLFEPLGCVGPARAPLLAAEVSEQRWLQVWRPFAAGFSKALSTDCTRAWELLSTAAEKALVGSEGLVIVIVPRAVMSRCFWSAFDGFIVGSPTLLVSLTMAFSGDDPLGALELVARLKLLVADEEKQAALKRWSRALEGDFGAQCAWVRRRCALEEEVEQSAVVLGDLEPRTALAPSEVIKQAASDWVPRWTARAARSDDAVRHALRAVPPVAAPQGSFHFEGAVLRGLAKRMKGKACGPDHWRAEDFLHLPSPFWNQLAALWQAVVQRGDVPRPWQRVRIALIPKRAGGCRPLSLLSIAWRTGSAALLEQLSGWSEQWLDHTLCGGVPGRSSKDLIFQLLAGMRQHQDSVVVAQDLEKFFDAIDLRDLQLVLEKLSAPRQLCSLVSAMYTGQERLFSRSGFLSESWVSASRGLCQGCPLSPLLAAAVLRGWTALLATTGVQPAAFVDDRYFWARDPVALTAAKAHSDAFDSAFGFRCDGRKCALAASPSSSTAPQVAEACGYGLSAQLRVLGLTVDFASDGAATPAAFDVQLLRRRLRLATVVSSCFAARRALLSRLVMPMLTWGGAFGVISVAQARALRHDFLFRVGSSTARDKAKPLCLAVLGFECDPVFMRRWSVLLETARLRMHTRRWQETAPLSVALQPLQTTLPAVVAVLAELGWWLTPGERGVERRDSVGQVRTFWFGFDSLEVLKEWLPDWHRRDALQSCGRLRQNYHRGVPGLAMGEYFPPVPPHTLCTFEGHVAAYQTGSFFAKQLALGYGCSAWDRAKRAQLEELPDCHCGLAAPSRPHLVWRCPAFPATRALLGRPADRLAERLLARPVPELPAPPVVLDVADFCESLAEELQSCSADALVVATDGSSCDHVAAASFAIDGGRTLSVGLPGEDQGSHKAELYGLVVLIRALLLLSIQGVCHVIVDCKALLDAFNGRGTLGLLVDELCAARSILQSRGLQVVLSWLPSHNKPLPAGWSSPCALAIDRLRALNARSDVQMLAVMLVFGSCVRFARRRPPPPGGTPAECMPHRLI
ncbi:unnamed protein product, partial [Symbiodinium necroappetens]